MAGKIGIFYFSGTGNTELVAKLIKENLEKRCAEAELRKIEEVTRDGADPNLNSYEMIGIGGPVYAFNLPAIVINFAKNLPDGAGKQVFLFTTAGDFGSYNAAWMLMTRNILEAKGYSVFYDRLFVMPANVLFPYPDEFAKQVCNEAIVRAGIMSDELISRKERRGKPGLFGRFSAFISYFEHFGALFFSRYMMRAKSSCTKCGACVKICPSGNIALKNGGISFGWKCLICMRCMYRCPAKAISPYCMDFLVFKDGYNIEKIAANHKLSGNFVNNDTKGYFKHFRDYFTNDSRWRAGS